MGAPSRGGAAGVARGAPTPHRSTRGDAPCDHSASKLPPKVVDATSLGKHTLVRCPANCFQKSFELGEDGVGGGGPGEWTGGGVVVRNEGVDAAHQLAHGPEGAAP